jgi:hypothetical protein
MGKTSANDRWLVYACRTSAFMTLDAAVYPSTLFYGRSIPWPPWACKAPDGGIHIDNRIGRIDVDLRERPRTRAELHWTWDFGVHLIADSWLSDIRDLIDENRTFLGDVRVGGKKIAGWSTVHEPNPPSLLSSQGKSKTCPVCGSFYTTLWGSLFISDQSAAGRSLFENQKGIFISEDLVLSRNLRRPAGVFKPWPVKLRPTPKA